MKTHKMRFIEGVILMWIMAIMLFFTPQAPDGLVLTVVLVFIVLTKQFVGLCRSEVTLWTW